MLQQIPFKWHPSALYDVEEIISMRMLYTHFFLVRMRAFQMKMLMKAVRGERLPCL
jgi:hypothetical protein